MMRKNNLKKLKIMTIVGTRPEIIRLSRVMAKLDQYCEHVIVHTGQNYDYELNEIFFTDLGLRRPDIFLNANAANAAETIGNVIVAVDKTLAEVNPDAILVLGDTNSCLSVIPAKRRKIPIFHMEAGNRCFDMRVPEEINRKIVDHTSDVNLTYSSIARENLLAEGLPSDLTFKIGSPMLEILDFYKDKIDNSIVLGSLGLEAEQYFVASIHREENVESSNFYKVVDILNNVAEVYQLPVIVSVHPRTRKKIEELGIEFDSKINLMKPLGFTDYIKLQLNAKAVISDSGTITEESAVLNFPAISLRETGERHEGVEEASVMMVGLDLDRVLQALAILETQERGTTRTLRAVSDYSMPNVSDKVVRIIHSYVGYVNRVVWKKMEA